MYDFICNVLNHSHVTNGGLDRIVGWGVGSGGWLSFLGEGDDAKERVSRF